MYKILIALNVSFFMASFALADELNGERFQYSHETGEDWDDEDLVEEYLPDDEPYSLDEEEPKEMQEETQEEPESRPGLGDQIQRYNSPGELRR